ncbi:MAG: GNAT family N-acetyltransferase [Dysgonamonadaceae bacterium]|jgi:predicted acetyltransferase|nr:GNAT family N-acetyltransferase [Dysgonamonadaceae bacterium]
MIRKGEDKYKEPLMSLWKRCFPSDTEAFIRFYFEKVYKDSETLLFINENQLVASLQMIPYPVKTGNSIGMAGYIYGAMTHPDFRKRGYMEKLLEFSFLEMKKNAYDYTFLIPQEDWLFGVYEKYGYTKAFPTSKDKTVEAPEQLSCLPRDKEIRVYKTPAEINLDDAYLVYYRFLTEKQNVILKTKNQFEHILEDLFCEKGHLLANDRGIAFVVFQREKAILKEFFYQDEETKQKFLYTTGKTYPGKEIVVQNSPGESFSCFKGMIKSLTGNNAPPVTDIYMSMMLDS